MLADDLDVGARPEDVGCGAQQLGPDRHRQEATGEQEPQHADHVLEADDLVVEGEAEVARPALARPLGQRLAADQLCERVIEGTDAEQPAEHADAQAEHDGDVVRPVRCGAVHGRVVAGDDVADPVAEQVAPDGADGGGADVLGQPPLTGLARQGDNR